MKAVRVHEYGGTNQLQYEDIPIPEPKSDEIRVKIEAAGVNFIEIYERQGKYPLSLPALLGREGAGMVDAVGDEVREVNTGDRVAFSMNRGGYAEYVNVPGWRAVPVPDQVNGQVAAAAMVQGLTAHYLSHTTYPLDDGKTAVIHAAAGGVGLLFIQMAKRRGAFVIGTVSTDEKAELARRAGADEVILYTQEDFQERTMEITDGKGVDAVYDSVGKTTFQKSLDCLKPRGYLVLFGQSSGPVDPIDPQDLNKKGSLFLTRPTLRDYASSREELLGRANEIFNWINSGELVVRVDKTFSLDKAAEAHSYMEGRKTRGKVLLIP